MTKLEVLKNYLQYVLDNKDEYNWIDHNTCNCGLLLKSIKEDQLDDKLDELLEYITQNNIYNGSSYTSLFRTIIENDICSVTGIKFVDVINKLLSYGFTLQELKGLECLRDTRFSTETTEFNNVNSLIEYLTNWIKYEEQLVQATTKEQVPVKVSIS